MAAYLKKTHSELLEKTDAWERSHWMALQAIDGPIGEWRDDLRAAMIAACAAGSGETDKFMPQWDKTTREKYEAAQKEAGRLQRAQRQLRGGS